MSLMVSSGMPAGGGALADGTGKAYKPKRFEAGWEIPGRGKGPSVVYPSKWVETTLVFDPPEGRTNGLKLELAGAGVGVPHPVRFTIPDSFLRVRRPQNRP